MGTYLDAPVPNANSSRACQLFRRYLSETLLPQGSMRLATSDDKTDTHACRECNLVEGM